MPLPLQGKVALVTGSTSGIGEAIAVKLASLGAHVAVTGSREADAAVTTLEKIREASRNEEYNVQVEYFRSDLGTDPFTSCTALHAEVKQRLGPIDILVNNAGMQHVANVEDFPVDKWQLLINCHLNASFMLMQLCLPDMKSKGSDAWGRIVNISSTHGLVASPGKSAYCAAKHALVGLTKAAALENAVGGVAINAICPGWVHTPLVQKQIDALAEREGIDNEVARMKLISVKEPSGRASSAEDIAEMTAVLCGPAGSNMKGSCISMDGGWTAI